MNQQNNPQIGDVYAIGIRQNTDGKWFYYWVDSNLTYQEQTTENPNVGFSMIVSSVMRVKLIGIRHFIIETK